MEELKNEQDRRDKRNQERAQLREGRQSDSSAVSGVVYWLFHQKSIESYFVLVIT